MTPRPKSDQPLTNEPGETSSGDPRTRLRDAKRVVVKLGTNVLCRENGELALGRIYSLIEEIVDAHGAGREVILVSSGSISLGQERLGMEASPERLVDKQACAAVGQIQLMSVYQHAFDRYSLSTAQILLTEEDFVNRRRYLNLRNTLVRLLELRVLPIVNENDTVSTTEIETPVDGSNARAVFGDNDVLSALVASKLGADLLIVLSDVSGLFDRPPSSDPDAKRISLVPQVTEEIEALARGGSTRGRGGMRTKLQAARVATRSGAMVVIAPGAQPGVLHSILSGEDVGTLFLPEKPLSSRKRWIAFANVVSGVVSVNAGAHAALVERSASLLFAGVVDIENDFEKGAIVSVLGEDRREFARGMVNFSSTDARSRQGRQSADLPTREKDKGGRVREEFIHCDNIVIL